MIPVRITLLVENRAKRKGLQAEHGLSYWIEAGSQNILFDTGQSPEVLQHNANHLNIDLAQADSIVLSHGHYDHTGGLEGLIEEGADTRLVLHREATCKRYSRSRLGSVHEVGMPRHLAVQIDNGFVQRLDSTTPIDLGDGLCVTGEIPRLTDFEDTGGDFFLDPECLEPDPIRDDQAIYFDTPQGLVVLLGCAHAGVVNTCLAIQSLTGGRPIHAIIGGFHLLNASGERLSRTLEALASLEPAILAPIHCTGDLASNLLWFEFPGIWKPLSAGDHLSFSLIF
jgi:7,8-dihydropterin-6-yl-methyl-4-(beta-D-ribofuranosyl)aminobenzene 5'-phosphate synthase